MFVYESLAYQLPLVTVVKPEGKDDNSQCELRTYHSGVAESSSLL